MRQKVKPTIITIAGFTAFKLVPRAGFEPATHETEHATPCATKGYPCPLPFAFLVFQRLRLPIPPPLRKCPGHFLTNRGCECRYFSGVSSHEPNYPLPGSFAGACFLLDQERPSFGRFGELLPGLRVGLLPRLCIQPRGLRLLPGEQGSARVRQVGFFDHH